MLVKLKDKYLAFKESKYAVLPIAFLLPALIFWLIYICMEVWPFGNNSVLVLDLNGQYVYFFEDLRTKLLEGGSLLYSWGRQLGGEFMGIFAYYLASPFSFLMVLFSKDHITECLLLIILLKTGCMGATMAYYLSQKELSKNKLSILIFSTCYALSSYAVVQAHNTMWIDNLIFLPLLVLGIEKLVKERKFILFVISLSMCLLTSFYIGYMTCIFTALYFFYYYFAHNTNYENNLYMEDNHFWKSLARIGVYSAIAIMMAFVIIYPAYTSLQFGKNEFSTPNYTFSQRFDWLDLFAKLFPGSYDTVRPEGLPFVYCGTIALILLPIFFCAGYIKTRRKIMSGLLIFTLVFSFNCSAIDIIWHGFQKPNWLNYRYSFMLIFLLLVFAYEAFAQLEKIDFKFLVISTLGLGLLLMSVQKADYEFIDDLETVLFSILCLIVMLLLLNACAKGYIGKAANLILLIAVCAELFVSGLFHTIDLDRDVVISSRDSYNDFMEKVQPLVDRIEEYDTSPFYRMEKNFHRKTNDPMALGYYGMSNSSSTLNASVVKLLNRFGYTSKSHWSKYLGGNIVSDSIFGVKYVMTRSPLKPSGYSLLMTDEETGYMAYTNPTALSLLYAVNADVEDLDFGAYYTPFDRMNALVTAMLGEDETVKLFVPVAHTMKTQNITEGSVQDNHAKYSATVAGQAATIEYSFTAPAGKELYVYFPTEWPRECQMQATSGYNGKYFGGDTHCIMSLGTRHSDVPMQVKLTVSEETPIYVKRGVNYFYTLDFEVYEEVFARLMEGNSTIETFEEDHFTATVTVPTGMGTMFTTIPYDAGWIVKVDGREVETQKTIDSLLSFPILPGEHTIEMTYLPDCIVYGRIISTAGTILFASAIVVDVFMRRRRNRKWAEANGIF